MLRKPIFAGFVAVAAFAAVATVVTDVETAMSHGNFPLAEAMLQSYRSQRGVTPEYLEALSWLARGDLITRQFDKADANAKETEKLAVQSLATRPLDAEPHLPLALGAAIEVEAQLLTANGDRAGALALLRKDLARASRRTSTCSRWKAGPRPHCKRPSSWAPSRLLCFRCAANPFCCFFGRIGVRTASRKSTSWPRWRASMGPKAW